MAFILIIRGVPAVSPTVRRCPLWTSTERGKLILAQVALQAMQADINRFWVKMPQRKRLYCAKQPKGICQQNGEAVRAKINQ